MTPRPSFPAARPADTTEAADTVRAALDRGSACEWKHGGPLGWQPAFRALDVLAAAARRTEQAEARLQDARFDAKAWEDNFLASERRAHDEKARAEQAETERDEWKRLLVSSAPELGRALARVRDLEAERDAALSQVAELEQALRDVLAIGSGDINYATIHSVARAALVSGAAEGNNDE